MMDLLLYACCLFVCFLFCFNYNVHEDNGVILALGHKSSIVL